MVKRIKEIEWEDGASEVIAFMFIFPLIIFAFLLIIYGMQLSLTAQTLQYSTYSATRAAVISENESTAIDNANAIIDNCMPEGYMNISDANFTYEYVEGNHWLKGNIIKGTVTLNTKLLIPFSRFTNDNGYATLHSSICMMIERPAV